KWLKRIAIFDESGNFLGESYGKTHFLAEVAPGNHVFTAYVNAKNKPSDTPGEGEGVHGTRATVLGGHIYLVEVTSYGAELLAVKPTVKSWGQKDEWIRSTRRLR